MSAAAALEHRSTLVHNATLLRKASVHSFVIFHPSTTTPLQHPNTPLSQTEPRTTANKRESDAALYPSAVRSCMRVNSRPLAVKPQPVPGGFADRTEARRAHAGEAGGDRKPINTRIKAQEPRLVGAITVRHRAGAARWARTQDIYRNLPAARRRPRGASNPL